MKRKSLKLISRKDQEKVHEDLDRLQEQVKWWDRPYSPSGWERLKALIAIIPYLPKSSLCRLTVALIYLLAGLIGASGLLYVLIWLGMAL